MNNHGHEGVCVTNTKFSSKNCEIVKYATYNYKHIVKYCRINVPVSWSSFTLRILCAINQPTAHNHHFRKLHAELQTPTLLKLLQLFFLRKLHADPNRLKLHRRRHRRHWQSSWQGKGSLWSLINSLTTPASCWCWEVYGHMKMVTRRKLWRACFGQIEKSEPKTKNVPDQCRLSPGYVTWADRHVSMNNRFSISVHNRWFSADLVAIWKKCIVHS